MRRLPILLGFVVVAILASCGGDNSAATTTQATTTTTTTLVTAVEVTGQQTCFYESEGMESGPPLDESGLAGSTLRDALLLCTDTTSDPRVSIESVNTLNCDFAFDGETTIGDCWGTIIGTNDGGKWEGTFVGTTTWSLTNPAHVHVIEATSVGSGDYAGLTYEATYEGIDLPWTLTGRIEQSQ